MITMVIFYLRVAEDQGSERDWASNLQTCSIVLLYLDVNMQSTIVFKKRTCMQICFCLFSVSDTQVATMECNYYFV